MTTNCAFCDIIKNSPTNIIAENDYAIAFLPRKMESFAHTLIVSKKHYENIFDIPENDLKNLMIFLQNIAKSYKSKLWATGINILNANWKDAQQSVFHIHFHLIPRFPNDNLDLRPKFHQYDWKNENIIQEIKKKLI